MDFSRSDWVVWVGDSTYRVRYNTGVPDPVERLLAATFPSSRSWRRVFLRSLSPDIFFDTFLYYALDGDRAVVDADFNEAHVRME